MSVMNEELIAGLLRAFERKDLDAVLGYFAEDALVYDPHYPTPTMQGKEAIRQGFGWGLDMIQQPGFAIRNAWTKDTSGVVEVDTHHVFPNGSEARFPQVFVFETRDGQVTRLQAYEPYPPPAPPAA